MKSSALTRLGLRPDPSTVPLHDLLTDRQSDPGPWIFALAVQALKDDKDSIQIFRLDSDAVVPYRYQPVPRFLLGLHAHDRCLTAPELDGVANQILEQLCELCRIPLDLRQRLARDSGARLSDCHLQIGQGPVQRPIAVHLLKGFTSR